MSGNEALHRPQYARASLARSTASRRSGLKSEPKRHSRAGLVNDYVATNTQRTLSMDESAWKMRREAEIAEAQLLLTPANEHLDKRRIALSKLADEAEQAARRLREGPHDMA